MNEFNKKIVLALTFVIGFISRRKRRFLFVCLLIVLAAAVYLRQTGYLSIEKLFLFINEFPAFAPFLFILIYALMVAFLIPTLPMNLGAGFLWGALLGWPITIIGSSLGALISFLISRYLLRNYFNAKFNNSIWALIKDEIQKKNWKAIAFTRVNPAFPFGLTSYFFGLTPVSLKEFVLSTVIFITPGTFLFSYVGHSIGGIILADEAQNLMRNIILISAAIAGFIIFHIAVKRYFDIRRDKKSAIKIDD